MPNKFRVLELRYLSICVHKLLMRASALVPSLSIVILLVQRQGQIDLRCEPPFAKSAIHVTLVRSEPSFFDRSVVVFNHCRYEFSGHDPA